MSRAQRRANLSGIRGVMAKPWEPMEQREFTDAQVQLASRSGTFVSGWLNNRYSAQVFHRVTEWGDVIHLAICRHDGATVQGWDDLQRIKGEVIGADRFAVEVYPSDEDVVAQANMRHLFVLPRGFVLPLTIKGQWT